MPAHRTDFRPHDLLWIADASLLASDQGLPDWASDSWLRRAPVVVRRESTNGGCIPVGLRGANRSDRVKAYLPASAVLRCTRPEDIVAARPWRRQSHLARFAAVLGLERLAERLQATGLQWGPTGGVGFTLASGIPVLRWDSDLDLVIRSPAPLTMALCASLSALGPNPSGTHDKSPDHADLVDASLTSATCSSDGWCSKSGYRFKLAAVCMERHCLEYVLRAVPVDANTGTRNFCSTSDGVIHVMPGAPWEAPLTASDCKHWPRIQ